MLRTLLTLFLVCILWGCSSTKPPNSAYNQGVTAYQAKDYQTARQEWQKAVAAGDLSALNNLGFLLYQGLGGEPDKKLAVTYWRQAAEKRHSEAQSHLAAAYEEGSVLPQSSIEAYAWYRCAIESTKSSADSDVEAYIAQDAAYALTKLLSKLQASEFIVAEALAKQYVQQYASSQSKHD